MLHGIGSSISACCVLVVEIVLIDKDLSKEQY